MWTPLLRMRVHVCRRAQPILNTLKPIKRVRRYPFMWPGYLYFSGGVRNVVLVHGNRWLETNKNVYMVAKTNLHICISLSPRHFIL